MMRKVKEARDLAKFVAREFSNLEYLMLIVDKLELLKEDPVIGGGHEVISWKC